MAKYILLVLLIIPLTCFGQNEALLKELQDQLRNKYWILKGYYSNDSFNSFSYPPNELHLYTAEDFEIGRDNYDCIDTTKSHVSFGLGPTGCHFDTVSKETRLLIITCGPKIIVKRKISKGRYEVCYVCNQGFYQMVLLIQKDNITFEGSDGPYGLANTKYKEVYVKINPPNDCKLLLKN